MAMMRNVKDGVEFVLESGERVRYVSKFQKRQTHGWWTTSRPDAAGNWGAAPPTISSMWTDMASRPFPTTGPLLLCPVSECDESYPAEWGEVAP
jgi:hypothetical protein